MITMLLFRYLTASQIAGYHLVGRDSAGLTDASARQGLAGAALGATIPGKCGRLSNRGRGAEISTRITVGVTTGDPSCGWGLRVSMACTSDGKFDAADRLASAIGHAPSAI